MNADYTLFAAIVEVGSLSGAARTLATSPAMVSKRLARLEARLGAQLLHRTTRRLALTPAGERFHADIATVLQLAREAEARVADGGAMPSGALRVSAPTSLGRLHIAPLLPAFLAAHPRVALTFDVTDAYVDMLAERIDVAIRIAPSVPAGLVARRLASNRRLLCASPDYVAQAGVPAALADLARHRLLAADGQFPWRLTDGQRVREIDGKSQVRTNSSEIVRELALADGGIALRSLWDVSGHLAAGRLVRVLPDWEGTADLAIYAVMPRSEHPLAAARALVAFLAERLDL